MASVAVSPHLAAQTVKGLQEILGLDLTWETRCQVQNLLRQHGCLEESHLPELRGFVTQDLAEMTLRLPVVLRNRIVDGVGNVYLWETATFPIELAGNTGVRKGGGVRLRGSDVVLYEAVGHIYPVVMIPSVSGDIMYITQTDRRPTSALKLLQAVQRINSAQTRALESYTCITIPSFVFRGHTPKGWKTGMRVTNGNGTSLAVKGAEFFAVSLRGFATQEPDLFCAGRTLAVGKPYMVWVKRIGVERPLVAIAY